MTPLETLKAARDLISDPARWTQFVQARDGHGTQVPHNDPTAHCFCIMGAVGRTAVQGNKMDALKVLSRVTRRNFDTSIPDYNDTHTHAEVLALFDAAIAELEAIQ